VSRRLRAAALLVAALAVSCVSRCAGRPKSVVHDLAARAPFAEAVSPRLVLLFGTPAAEPAQAEGFFREASQGQETFLWVKREAEIALRFDALARRVAVLDAAPYEKVGGQAAEVFLNGQPVGRFALNDARHRYRIELPEAAQRNGENRLRLAFAAAASPADGDPKSQDRRELAAALYSLVVGRADDQGMDDLLARGAPAPFAVAAGEGGAPALTLVGPAALRFALELPAGAELRFTPALHPSARAAAASATLSVKLEDARGERELWTRTLGPRDAASGEVAIDLPGAPGDVARLSLEIKGDRFAWGVLTAPRVLGERGPEPGADPALAGRVKALRDGLGQPNVLLVVLDAGRAQQFGCYGHGKPTTPEIDRIAAEGIVFESAVTPAVYTLGAMSSVWTSQYPDRHHGDVSFSAGLPRDRLTLPEVLGAQGIHSAGFVANAVAGRLNGFDRGFSEFHEVWQKVGSAADSFRRVLPDWLRANAGRRFLAYVHFREPHFPYDPPPPFDTRFGPEGPISRAQRRDSAFFTDLNQGRRQAAPGEIDHLVSLYDGNLGFADQEVGAIRRELEATGLLEKTVLIVMADHGEGLFEHGWVGHNVDLHEESTHVPLIVRFPAGKGPKGKRVAGLVDLLDVAPTIAELLGVSDQGGWRQKFQGRSLLPMIEGAAGKPAVLSRTVWDRPRYAYRDARYKLIHDTRTGESQLLDLQADPGERRDVAREQPLRTAALRESLFEWIARVTRRAPAGASGGEQAPTCEQCETLKSLGYLGPDTKCPCP
jgi:arylsulfatase A-like enzyme